MARAQRYGAGVADGRQEAFARERALADLSGVRFVASSHRLDLPVVQDLGSSTLYRNPDAMPRAWLVGCTRPGDAIEAGFDPRSEAVVDGETGERHNTAIVYAADGSELARYRKIHLPEEEGYWETSHYVPGTDAPIAFDGLPLRAGLQICSDDTDSAFRRTSRPVSFVIIQRPELKLT